MYSRNTNVRDKLLALQAVLQQQQCTMFAQHIPGVQNTVADDLSRTNLGDSYRLHRATFKMLQLISAPSTVDRFACASNAQLEVFNTMLNEPGSAGVDAFAQNDYLEHVNFMFPPVAMLSRVGNLLLQAWPTARAILVFPYWTTQPWFNLVHGMCDTCFLLPQRGSALFDKVHAFPMHPPVRNENWQFVVGFRNLPILQDPQWVRL